MIITIFITISINMDKQNTFCEELITVLCSLRDLKMMKITISLFSLVLVFVCVEGTTIELQSWSYEDKDKTGFVKIDGRIILASAHLDFNSTILRRGITVLVFDQTFKEVSRGLFDTWEDSSSAGKLTNYVQAIPMHHYFIGITADTVYPYIKQAEPILISYGVTLLRNLGARDSLVFLGMRGYPEVTKQAYSTRGQGPVYRKFRITGCVPQIVTESEI